MTFEEYQKLSRKTALYPNAGKNIFYPTLGLASEAGEVCGKIKKVHRDKKDVFGQEDKDTIEKELGDVLWYLAQIASELGISLENVADGNIKKLYSRLERNKIGGDGDNR
ncbi:MAG TPA: nucleoside triphosphate pyrophosphohydrolase family protein [Candidatus Paceibacterota bacterium]